MSTMKEAMEAWNKKAESRNNGTDASGLPVREPKRDVSRSGNCKVRLRPVRRDWKRSPKQWENRR